MAIKARGPDRGEQVMFLGQIRSHARSHTHGGESPVVHMGVVHCMCPSTSQDGLDRYMERFSVTET